MSEENEKFDKLQAMMKQRIDWTETKNVAEKLLKDLDEDIKTFMIMHDVQYYQNDGMQMKVANGKNSVIIKQRLIAKLMEWELDPDQIREFMAEVTKETPYDYIDCRKIKDKEVEGE